MLLWSSAIDSGVAPPLPGSSSGLVALPLYCGEPSSEPGDRGGDQLDVRDLLGAHAVEQVLVRLARRPAEVERLEQVLHHRPHLAELTAQTLLEGVGGGRVRLVGDDLVDQTLDVHEHRVTSLSGKSYGHPWYPPGRGAHEFSWRQIGRPSRA